MEGTPPGLAVDIVGLPRNSDHKRGKVPLNTVPDLAKELVSARVNGQRAS